MSHRNGRSRRAAAAAPTRALVRSIVETGRVSFSKRAVEEDEQLRISETDVIGVLWGGLIDSVERKSRPWRYRFWMGTMFAIVTFRSDTWMVVVTAWRTNREPPQ